jgi:hypothetical protein
MIKSRLLMISMATLLATAPTFAGDREFHEIVSRVAEGHTTRNPCE